MEYGKLIDGTLISAPEPLVGEEFTVYNPTADLLEEAGYKPVVYTDPPTVEPGWIAVPGWDEEDDEIVQVWNIVEEPDEVDADRALEILFGGEG